MYYIFFTLNVSISVWKDRIYITVCYHVVINIYLPVSHKLDAMQPPHLTSHFRLRECEILQLLDDLDEGNVEPGDIVLHIPNESGTVFSDVDSDSSDEETN